MESQEIYTQQKEFLKDFLKDIEKMDIGENNVFYNNYKQIIKSQFIIMLYTLLESVVMQGLQDIFDHIKQTKTCFYDLKDEVKKIYVKAKIKNKERHFNQILGEDLIELIKKLYEIKKVDIDLKKDFTNENPFNAGALNYQNIDKYIIKNFVLNDIDVSEYNKIFRIKIQETIKENTENRNKLAHGEISFQDFGKDITIKELRIRYISVIIYLYKYLKSIKNYINNQGYKDE